MNDIDANAAVIFVEDGQLEQEAAAKQEADLAEALAQDVAAIE